MLYTTGLLVVIVVGLIVWVNKLHNNVVGINSIIHTQGVINDKQLDMLEQVQHEHNKLVAQIFVVAKNFQGAEKTEGDNVHH